MLRCIKCDKPIEEERIKAHMGLTDNKQLPEECAGCAALHTEPVLGFMTIDGTHGARKVGAELVSISPVGNPNYKEMVRQAKRVSRRAR